MLIAFASGVLTLSVRGDGGVLKVIKTLQRRGLLDAIDPKLASAFVRRACA